MVSKLLWLFTELQLGRDTTLVHSVENIPQHPIVQLNLLITCSGIWGKLQKQKQNIRETHKIKSNQEKVTMQNSA